jgi:hypothetical protein
MSASFGYLQQTPHAMMCGNRLLVPVIMLIIGLIFKPQRAHGSKNHRQSHTENPSKVPHSHLFSIIESI